MKNIFETLFTYKVWANDDIFSVLKTLSSEDHKQELYSCVRILNHVYVVDSIFQANLQHKQHSYKALNTAEMPTLSQLAESVSDLDAWYLRYVQNLSLHDLTEVVEFQFVDGKPGRMSRSEMLLHINNHGCYHRGAAGRVLVQIDADAPSDTLTVFLHSGTKYRAV